jgi:hypothetical protein
MQPVATLVKEEKQEVIKHVLRIYKEKSGELEEIIKEE